MSEGVDPALLFGGDSAPTPAPPSILDQIAKNKENRPAAPAAAAGGAGSLMEQLKKGKNLRPTPDASDAPPPDSPGPSGGGNDMLSQIKNAKLKKVEAPVERRGSTGGGAAPTELMSQMQKILE